MRAALMESYKHSLKYLQLIRLDKPVGILLLLWPTMWALWISNQGAPPFSLFLIFVLGTILMRSFGCVLNDIADRNFDVAVERTKKRPLAAKQITVFSALVAALVLGILALSLLLLCNALTIKLGLLGALIAAIYPYLKRITQLPQLGLGFAFAWGVPMAFAASLNDVPFSAWFLYATTVLWPIIYDTMYAMADRSDDIKIGVKSAAILFGKYDRIIIGLLQIVFLILLSVAGILFHLQAVYQFSLLGAVILFIYQQWLIKDRLPADCVDAFKNNNYVGLIVFLGILWGQAT